MKYYLLDGAKCNEDLEDTLKAAEKHTSLYRGRSEENLSSVAPYLIEVTSGFEQWILKNGWNQSWGYFLESDLPFEAMYSHFRKFLIVENEDFRPLYFRFYDPRVIRIFLPTCDNNQLQSFLGPIDCLICEMADKESMVLIYNFNGSSLKLMEAEKNQHFLPWIEHNESPNISTENQIPVEKQAPSTSSEALGNQSEAHTRPKRKFIY